MLSQPRDLRAAETWSNFLVPRIILQAKFWMSWSLEMFFLEVLPHTLEQKKPAKNKSLDN